MYLISKIDATGTVAISKNTTAIIFSTFLLICLLGLMIGNIGCIVVRL